MSEWKAKRFWTDATVDECGNGFEVLLDGRRLKTPAKAPLTLPTRPLAEAVAEEWRAQEDMVNPATMPVTRSANAALDKTAPQMAEVAEMVAEYGGTDLLCYRATNPAELIARQAADWDPMLEWAATTLGARLTPTGGVIPVQQPGDALDALRNRVDRLDAFQLTAFHDLVSLSGSLVLGFAAIHGPFDAEALWQMSRLDERWQEEQWGPDEEATEAAGIKRQAFHHALRFYRLATP